MVLYIIILFKVEIIMLRFFLFLIFIILLNYFFIFCVLEYYIVFYFFRFGKGIYDSVGVKFLLKVKLIFKFLNMYM